MAVMMISNTILLPNFPLKNINPNQITIVQKILFEFSFPYIYNIPPNTGRVKLDFVSVSKKPNQQKKNGRL
jgi:hypothetical protein